MNKWKILFLLGFFCLFSMNFVFAQDLSSGRIMIAGESDFGFFSQAIEYEGGGEHKTTGFGLDVAGSYFIMDNIGVEAYFGFDSSTVKNSSETKTTEMALGVGGKYYFDIGSELFPYGGAFLGYRNMKYENGYEQTISGIEFGFGGGVLYFVNDNVAAKAGFDYSIGMGKAKNGEEYDVDMSELAFKVGIAVLI